MKIQFTAVDLDALDSIYRRAEEDWANYYQSGYGPRDFPSRAEWREHVRNVNADFRRVGKLLNRASAASARAQHFPTHSKKGQSK